MFIVRKGTILHIGDKMDLNVWLKQCIISCIDSINWKEGELAKYEMTELTEQPTTGFTTYRSRSEIRCR